MLIRCSTASCRRAGDRTTSDRHFHPSALRRKTLLGYPLCWRCLLATALRWRRTRCNKLILTARKIGKSDLQIRAGAKQSANCRDPLYRENAAGAGHHVRDAAKSAGSDVDIGKIMPLGSRVEIGID